MKTRKIEDIQAEIWNRSSANTNEWYSLSHMPKSRAHGRPGDDVLYSGALYLFVLSNEPKVTPLVPRILSFLLEFWKIRGPCSPHCNFRRWYSQPALANSSGLNTYRFESSPIRMQGACYYYCVIWRQRLFLNYTASMLDECISMKYEEGGTEILPMYSDKKKLPKYQ